VTGIIDQSGGDWRAFNNHAKENGEPQTEYRLSQTDEHNRRNLH